MGALQLDIMKIKQILLLLKNGCSNREISKEIGASRNTVNEYVKKIKSFGTNYDFLLSKDENELQSHFSSRDILDNERYKKVIAMFPDFAIEIKKPGCTP